MEKPHTAPVAKQVVFVIDDDSLVCSSLKLSLEAEGFTVRTYSGAYEFLNATDLPAKSSSDCYYRLCKRHTARPVSRSRHAADRKAVPAKCLDGTNPRRPS